ncbi:MAG: phosphatase PAP2-related protein [Bacteroidota bacterium]
MNKPHPQPSAKEAWKGALNNVNFRWQFIVTLLILSTFTFIFKHFFDYIESRQGTQLGDFVLDLLPAYNVSWGVFFILYSAIVIGIYTHRAHPKTVLIIFQTYILVTFVRMITITLLPLEPPIGYLPLREPVVQFFTNGGKIISKDLFFSGHVSTVLSVYLGTHLPKTKSVLLVCVVAMCVLLLVQHVHYTIDVLVAVPATYVVFRFCKKFLGGN